jgi:hypothetical protein
MAAARNKTPLMPLMRLQYRGLPDDKRQVRYSKRFATVTETIRRQGCDRHAGSREILGEDPAAIYEKWHERSPNSAADR